MNFLLKIFLMVGLGLCATALFAEMRDPTRPADYGFTPIAQGPLVLSAIFIRKDSRIAVINDVIVKVGDAVSGSKVTAIDVNAVQLQGVSGRITLFLLGNSIKQPVENNLP